MAMLEVKDINVYYGLIHALRDVSFEVNEGEVVALIGANGAGKTTTLHTVTGLLPSKGGTVTFEGKDITHKPGHAIVKLGMSHGRSCRSYQRDGCSHPCGGRHSGRSGHDLRPAGREREGEQAAQGAGQRRDRAQRLYRGLHR